MPWRSPQSNLRGQHLEVCLSPPKKKSPWRVPGCLHHFSPDWQHTPGEPRRRTRTLIQSDTPDLSWAAKLAHCALRPAQMKRPYSAMQAVPSPPTSPTPTPPLLPSQELARWMPGTAHRQPFNLRGSQPQNKGMPSEFGHDKRLVFPTAPLGGVKIFVISGLLSLYYKLGILLCKGAFLLWPYTI